MAAGRLDDAGTVAVQTATLDRVQPARAVARPAVLLSCDGDRTLAATHRVLEAERDRLMEVGPALRRAGLAAQLALVQHVGEQIAEGRR